MKFENFFKKNLRKIKEELCFALIIEKDSNKRTILHHLFWSKKNLEIVKYVLNFCKDFYPSLFLERDDTGCTILPYLMFGNNKTKTIKYVLNFCKDFCPSLFLEKDNQKCNFLPYISPYSCISVINKIIYIHTYIENNFPEVSRFTIITQKTSDILCERRNHLILPLTFQIQN